MKDGIRINVYKEEDGKITFMLPTMTATCDGDELKFTEYYGEGESKEGSANLRSCSAYDFLNMIKNQLK